MCPSCKYTSLKEVQGFVNTIDDDAVFENGQQIACGKCKINGNKKGVLCVFAQNMDGMYITGSLVKEKLVELLKHVLRGDGVCP